MQSDEYYDLPFGKRQRKVRKRVKRKERKEENITPRFVSTKKRTKFNKHQLMRML